MDITKIIQQIQYVLAPAIMISSSALLLLGFHNKFSNLANRFRSLNQEKRALAAKPQKDAVEEARFRNLTEQVDQLMRRATYVKNAILATYLGIVCFAGTSILIFLNIYASFQFYTCIYAVFAMGLIFILASCAFMIMETNVFYKIMVLEKKS